MRVLEQDRSEILSLRMSNAAPVEGGGPSEATFERYPDRWRNSIRFRSFAAEQVGLKPAIFGVSKSQSAYAEICLLYTSDAADD